MGDIPWTAEAREKINIELRKDPRVKAIFWHHEWETLGISVERGAQVDQAWADSICKMVNTEGIYDVTVNIVPIGGLQAWPVLATSDCRKKL